MIAGFSRFRSAADLSYHLQQALRHACQLEAYLTHGLDTSDALIMLANDMLKANQALGEYREAARLREKGKLHDTPQ